ncbi:MAG TPA: HAMP domain-containing sensor histidine kinase [Tepidisphaeraceae bacterium]|nr:HAMP domain-containing sensor histidine kinase [Tepidisphaeraceae bacterium]
MLDVATDVLHNVGNAINTVNVTASVLERRLRDEDYGGICKAANMIGQHCARLNQVSNDELCGGEVHDYLNNLAELLESDRKQSLFDLGRLRQKVEHIHQIISTQLSHAASARFTPSEEFAAIMQSVLLMNDEALRSRGISVTTDIVNVSVLPMNKVKFMQVMNNMVINAIQAAPPTGGLINIHAWRDSHSIRIEVKDNGSGIKSGDLSLLFKLGFTTRRQGRGCGLHYCQTAIEEAGGKLIAESEGAGCGAKFTILLPATEETPKMETFDGQVATR